jgi:hypothetical protein
MAAAKFKSSIELNVLIRQEGLVVVTQTIDLRITAKLRKLTACATLRYIRGNYTSVRDASAVDTRFLERSSLKFIRRRWRAGQKDYLPIVIGHLSFANLR